METTNGSTIGDDVGCAMCDARRRNDTTTQREGGGMSKGRVVLQTEREENTPLSRALTVELSATVELGVGRLLSAGRILKGQLV